jgi:hypothetical protein
MSIKAKAKGNNYELQIRDFFIKNGWDKAVTSRLESKSKDDAGIDLCYTDPFNVQCKAVESLGSVHKILDKMPKDQNYNLVFHKRNRQGTIVCMTLEDFEELIMMLKTII